MSRAKTISIWPCRPVPVGRVRGVGGSGGAGLVGGGGRCAGETRLSVGVSSRAAGD